MKTKKLYQKMLSMVLALVMVVSVFAVSAPAEVSAATAEKSFKGKGKSAVTIKMEEFFDATTLKAKDVYIKLKPTVTGYITLTLAPTSATEAANPNYTYGFIQLLDAKKKAITEEEEYDLHSGWPKEVRTKTYGVEKGKTYYFSVGGMIGTKISANVVSVAKSKGTSQKKAVELKQKKNTKGVVIAGTKNATWYKIKLTKEAKLRLTYTAKTHGLTYSSGKYMTTGGIKITFLNTKGKKWGSGASTNMTVANVKDGFDIYMGNQYGATKGIPAGTYFIKVEPTTKKKFSGYYTLKWTTYK